MTLQMTWMVHRLIRLEKNLSGKSSTEILTTFILKLTRFKKAT